MALRCPACMAVVLSRRSPSCSACHNPLPAGFLLTPDELAAVEGAEEAGRAGRDRQGQRRSGEVDGPSLTSPAPEAASRPIRGDVPGPTGLKPTLRHLMIVILWSALLLAALRMGRGLGLLAAPPPVACMTVALLVATSPMMLLCVLLWVFDRRGPVRAWYFSCGSAGGGLLAGAIYLLADLACFALSGRPTLIFPMFPFVALVCFWGGAMQLRAAWPRRCPGCGRRAVIAAVDPARSARRHGLLGPRAWCAACGRAYEKEGTTAWLPKAERVEGSPIDTLEHVG